MEKGLISIVMPAFNVEKYIVKSLSSILSQTYENFELIIGDDGSTDFTLDRIRSFDDPRIKIIPIPNKLGYTKVCNYLFPFCKGEFITFQDADDYSEPTRLEKQYTHLRNNSNLAMCGTGVVLITETGRPLDIIHRSRRYDEILEGLPHHNQFIGSTIMIRKSVFDQIGGYRPEFSKWGNQDYDWAYRICEKFPAENIALPLYYYRQNIFSNSKKISELRAIGPAMVQAFGSQRNAYGADMITKGDYNAIADLEMELLKPYMQDRSLIYHSHALNRIYIHQYKEAWRLIIRSILLRPFLIRNYKPIPGLIVRIAFRFIKYKGKL